MSQYLHTNLIRLINKTADITFQFVRKKPGIHDFFCLLPILHFFMCVGFLQQDKVLIGVKEHRH